MLSNTVVGLEAGQGNRTTMSDPKGQTLADAWLSDRGDFLILETEPGIQRKLRESLDRFLITEDTTLADATGAWAIVGIHGPASPGILNSFLSEPLPDLPEGDSVNRVASGTEVTVTSKRYTGEVGFDLWCSPESAEAVWTLAAQAGATPVGYEASEVLRIEAGVACYGSDFGEETIVLEAGLEHAVDFTKGCFIGQEPIAKMHHRGKPRRLLTGLRLERGHLPAAGTPLFVDGKRIGALGSSRVSPALDAVVALAMLRRGMEAPGTEVRLEDGRAGQVCALPFIRTSTPS